MWASVTRTLFITLVVEDKNLEGQVLHDLKPHQIKYVTVNGQKGQVLK